MRRFRSLSAAAVALLPVMALSPAVAHAGARQAQSPRQAFYLASGMHYGQPGNASGYSEILTAGRTIWAFGGTNPGGRSAPVAVIRVGTSWQLSRLPTGLTDFISNASAPDSRDIWAISGYGRYVLHWNGTRWQVARRWNMQGALSGVIALSHRNVWVFGTSPGGDRTIGTWHFNGRQWMPVKTAARDIYRASAISARDIWAIAADPHGDSIVRLGVRGWRHVRTGRALVGVRWHDILAESPEDVWLLGNDDTRLGSGRLVLAHWDGKHWNRINTALHAWAGQLAAVGRGSVAATATSSGLLADGLIVQTTSRGRLAWSTIESSLGSGVSDIVYVPGTHTLWASGGTLTRLGGDAAIWARVIPQPGRKAIPQSK